MFGGERGRIEALIGGKEGGERRGGPWRRERKQGICLEGRKWRERMREHGGRRRGEGLRWRHGE